MSMLGFHEAFEYSITVRLMSDPELDIKLPTLPGLVLMKVISWEEKYPERQKDAEDLLFIMHKYEYAGNGDRLYREEQSVLQEEGYDNRLAGIRLLGRDMAKIADTETIRVVKSILNRETGEQIRYRLVVDMLKGAFMSGDKFEVILREVEKLKEGFLEVAGDMIK